VEKVNPGEDLKELSLGRESWKQICWTVTKRPVTRKKKNNIEKLEFAETPTQIKEHKIQVKDEIDVDDNRIVLSDRNTSKPLNRYNLWNHETMMRQ